ncbi:uncharacterized protein LOC126980798 [Eriocheir sinensis]|uniref:uncharacterized protein LOC126980798 n=1 Tax=Eriocheir sinensis TaxID=95602 RepID=UPI0021C91719|nr:uncharacterized protein LOC126980798 [Eriocheir sinensis]
MAENSPRKNLTLARVYIYLKKTEAASKAVFTPSLVNARISPPASRLALLKLPHHNHVICPNDLRAGEPAQKRSKFNWSPDETVFLHQIQEKIRIIRGCYGKSITPEDKKRAWTEVAEAVTSAFPGSGPRTQDDCERRWYNVQQKSKPCIAKCKNEQRQTDTHFISIARDHPSTLFITCGKDTISCSGNSHRFNICWPYDTSHCFIICWPYDTSHCFIICWPYDTSHCFIICWPYDTSHCFIICWPNDTCHCKG